MYTVGHTLTCWVTNIIIYHFIDIPVLNREDPEWFWIVRSDGQEGFIPSGFVYAADNVLQDNSKLSGNCVTTSGPQSLGNLNSAQGNNNSTNPITGNAVSIANVAAMASSNNNNNNPTTLMNIANGMASTNPVAPPAGGAHPALGGSGTDDLRYHGTELVMLYDYKAQAPDDLSVRRGDWIYADLNNQTVDGWLWAYAPKTRKYGFIPKAYARPPAMTSL